MLDKVNVLDTLKVSNNVLDTLKVLDNDGHPQGVRRDRHPQGVEQDRHPQGVEQDEHPQGVEQVGHHRGVAAGLLAGEVQRSGKVAWSRKSGAAQWDGR